jgi:hypothetical protein
MTDESPQAYCKCGQWIPNHNYYYCTEPNAVPVPEATMTDHIEPALSEAEWKGVRSGADDVTRYYFTKGRLAAVIAACNDELPDSDPRKITREMIEALRSAASFVPDFYAADANGDNIVALCHSLADALESYLPPEGHTA